MDKTSTVYMGEMQRIQDLLTYAINQQQITSVRVFTDNQATLQVLKNSNKWFVPQIMWGTIIQLDTLRT